MSPPPRPSLLRAHAHHGRQVAAPAHFLAPVALGKQEPVGPHAAVVVQAAVLRDTCKHGRRLRSLCAHALGKHCPRRTHPETDHSPPSPGDKEASSAHL